LVCGELGRAIFSLEEAESEVEGGGYLFYEVGQLVEVAGGAETMLAGVKRRRIRRGRFAGLKLETDLAVPEDGAALARRWARKLWVKSSWDEVVGIVFVHFYFFEDDGLVPWRVLGEKVGWRTRSVRSRGRRGCFSCEDLEV